MKSKIATGTLRIIGGQWRSRKLDFPAVEQLRPTANRIRETLFNWLQEELPYEDCLDLFAGSGACGLEALSRGANQVTFVEQNPLAADAIAANLKLLGAPGMPVICSDAIDWLKNQDHPESRKYGIVFIDPPYAAELEAESCQLLENSGVLKDQALIYVESNRNLPDNLFPAEWRMIRKKHAGAVYFVLMERRIDGRPESRPE